MKRKKNTNDGTENWSHKHDYPIDEVWNTDNTLALLIAQRLRAFRELDKHGCPQDMKDMQQWNWTLLKMENAFELMSCTYFYSDKDRKTAQEGLELFCKYFLDLWD